MDLNVDGICKINDETQFGHSFNVNMTLVEDRDYPNTGDLEDCTLTWQERTNIPYLMELGWQPGEWLNLTEHTGITNIFNPWLDRENNQGICNVNITDTPTIKSDETKKRVLEILIKLTNSNFLSKIYIIRQQLEYNAEAGIVKQEIFKKLTEDDAFFSEFHAKFITQQKFDQMYPNKSEDPINFLHI